MKYIAIFVASICFFCSCRSKGISGKVVDVFGNPIKDVTVQIVGTEFKCESNSDGEFVLDYAPGNNIEIKMEKESYIPSSIIKSITEKTSISLTDIVMYPKTKHENFLYVNQDKKAFDTLKMKEVQKTSNDFEQGLMYYSQETYSAYLPDISPKNPMGEIHIPTIKSHDLNVFVCPTKSYTLVKCSGEGPNAEILMRKIRNGDLGFYAGDFKDHFNKIETQILIEYDNGNFTVFQCNKLTNGTYAWVRYHKDKKRAIEPYVYFFNVQ